jgi:hypothetical protein
MSRRSQSCSSENSLKCRAADEDFLLPGEQFGKMAIIHAIVETLRAGQLEDPNLGRRAEFPGRGSAPVAVHEPVCFSFEKPASQSPGATFAQPEQSDRLICGQDASDPAG